MHYYKFNIADYRKDTVHLTRAEHSIYRDLIDWYYMDEKPISYDVGFIVRRLRLVTEEDQDALINVLADFFTLTDDGYRHLRIDEEIAEYHKKADLNKKNGKKGGRPPKKNPEETEKNPNGFQSVPRRFPDETQTDATHNPDETQTKPNRNPNHKPLTINQEPSLKDICASGDAPPQDQENNPPVDPPKKTKCRFDEFWAVYPKRRDRKKARDAWQRKKLDSIADVLINDIKNRIVNDGQWLKGYIPLATTYFNGERWNDELEQPTEQNQKQHDNRNGGGSALDKVLAGINATTQGHHEQALGDDDSIVRPQMGEQLRGGSGPDGSMGSIFEGDFTRHD